MCSLAQASLVTAASLWLAAMKTAMAGLLAARPTQLVRAAIAQLTRIWVAAARRSEALPSSFSVQHMLSVLVVVIQLARLYH